MLNEGMKELNQLLNQLKTYIDASDVQKSKELLKQLGEVRKKYHENLVLSKNTEKLIIAIT